MRKKYLSALLFGALLVTSAGTFTSCKDYDDEINDLQEQINTVKTDLESLKSTVEGLDGIKTLSYADGKLIIETGKGTKVEVPVPSATGVTEVKLEGNTLYVDGKEAGKVEIPEGETVKVEVKEDGKLYINDEVQDLEIGSKVVMVDNGDGTYTMTVDGKSYVLPKASASILALTVDAKTEYTSNSKIVYFSEDYLTDGTAYDTNAGTTKKGINWGLASEDLADWTGPKGTVKKGQLLVGAINTLDVTVTPLKADLSQAKLTLVDMNGKEAPAKLVATPKVEEDVTTGSRAASIDGTWTLSITPTATAENMGTAYTAKNPAGDVKNAAYALAVDGVVMTGYNIAVDTWTNDEVKVNEDKPAITTTNGSTKLFFGDDAVVCASLGASYTIANVALGKTKITYQDASVYDIQVDIAPESIEDAELLDITLDKTTNTLNVSDKAANNQDGKIKLNVTLLGVNGLKSEKTTQVTISKFGATSVEDKQTIATTEYTMTTSTATNAKNIIINMEDVFTSLSADQSTDLASSNGVVWTCAELFGNTITPTYYASLEDAQAMKNQIDINDNETGSRVRSIKYAVIAVSDYADTFKGDAKADKYDLEVVLSTSKGEIKKVVAPINITLPSFDSIFTKVDDGLWTEEGRVVVLSGGKKITLSGIYESKTVANVNNNVKIKSLKFINASDEEKVIGQNATIGSAVDFNGTELLTSDGFVAAETIDATVYYAFTGAMTIESSFTVLVKSQFADPALVYYSAKNTVATEAVLNGTNIIIGGLASADNGGLSLKYNGQEVAAHNAVKGAFNAGTKVGRFTLSKGTTAPANNQTVNYDITVEGIGVVCSADVTSTGIQVTPVSQNDQIISGQKGKLVITFIDNDGVKTKAEIPFKKQ